ncbi:MAG: hypothetical protein NVS2B14_21530 [Chamaesiphon sp.]
MFGREVVLIAAVIRVDIGRRRTAEAFERDGPLALRQDAVGELAVAVGSQVNVFLV